ncbi:MAG: hypothetical protein GXY36_04700 [Chloroflexi bacterium]|nr:hypothetical protein [Chloroflexota bacterium]
MNRNRPFQNVPRPVLNAAVIVGGLLSLMLQSRFEWDILTTFVITFGLCGLCAAAVSLFYARRR